MPDPDPGEPAPRVVPVRTLAIEEVRTALRDGTRVLIRPIRPDDKELLRDGFRRMSEESRLRRFMAPLDELSESQLAYLTEIDYVDHFAWAAVLAEEPATGVGVGRYVRLREEPDVAEAAITIVDEYQGKGLGTLLLGMLAATARTAGITTFRGYVMRDNQPMRELLADIGARIRAPDSPGVLVMDVPLDPARLPDSPAGRVLKGIARRVIPATSRLEL
jgi:RimJ/RimL family protein N-acetyltransferase